MYVPCLLTKNAARYPTIAGLSAHSCIKVVTTQNLLVNIWEPRMQEHSIADIYVLPVHV